jgi:hypothetical protein
MSINNFKHAIPYDSHGITGGISVKLPSQQTLDDFCLKYIPNYNKNRFEAITIRLFAGKENIITVFALDKLHPVSDHAAGKLSVKKFKIENIYPDRLLSFFESYNFTLSKDSYQIEEMEVINK